MSIPTHATPPWPRMRADFRNTGCRIFGWNSQLGRVRHFDTNVDGLSLINATPVIGSDETVYVGSSNLIFYAWRDDGANGGNGSACGYTDKSDNSQSNIVDSAACLTSDTELFFPCGNYSLYSISTPPLAECEKIGDIANGRRSLSSVSSPSTIQWLEGNVVSDEAGNLFAGCDNFFLLSCNETPKMQALQQADSDTKEGYFRWGFPTGFFIWSACAFSPDQKALYFVSADMTCYALDPDSGKELWECQIGNLAAASPTVTLDNRVIFGAFDGKIYCLNGSNGDQQWAYSTGSVIYASPALCDRDNRVFVMSSDGVLRSLDISTSPPKLLWEFFTGMPSFSSAAIGPDPTVQDPYLIYVGSGDGLVYALTPNGLRRWSYDIAAFYAEQSSKDGADPAFWPAFRYPAINSSLALGNRGAVTATSGGFVLSIPYDAYQHTDSAFFKTNPHDNYWAQLPQSGISLCYVSPAGRMANDLLPEKIQVYAGQTISLAGLCRHLDGPTPRSSFTNLPTDVQVRVNGAAHNDWKLSADRTQVHLASPLPQSNEDGFELEISQPGGQILGRTQCIYRTVQHPASLDDVLKSQYSVRQMSFYTPFIVPALDQLGLATITIPFKFLSIDKNTGAAVAYGYESYASGASEAPRRNLIYTFTGSYAAGSFRLLSGSCYYELTGFPVLLDQLSISGMLYYSEAASSQGLEYTGVSLTASYRSTLLKQIEWLLTYLSHWVDLGQLLPNWSDLWKNFSLTGLLDALNNLVNNLTGSPTANGRFATFLLRVISGEIFGSSIFAPWKLFDKEDGFFWVGTYELSSSAPKPSSYTASFSYNSWSGNLEVKVNDCEPGDVVGIVVLDQNCQPLPLNYTDRNLLPTYQHETKTITQSLSLLGTFLDPDAILEAAVMVNLEQAEPKYKFSPGQNKK